MRKEKRPKLERLQNQAQPRSQALPSRGGKSLGTRLNQAMRIVLHANRKTCTQEMRAKLHLLSLYGRRRLIRLQYVYKIVNNINCPKQLTGYLVRS